MDIMCGELSGRDKQRTYNYIIIMLVLFKLNTCFYQYFVRSQLSHHDSILRATFRLRQVTHQNGDTPHGSSSSQLGQPKESSTPYKP